MRGLVGLGVLGLVGVLLGSCIDRSLASVDTAVVPNGESKVISRAGVRDVDVLFVIDDTSAMADKQAALAGALGTYMRTLEGMKGGLPNVHIGVVSASVAAGAAGPAACTGDGELLSQARVEGCAPPDGNYLSDVAQPDGTRARNYTGSLEDAFVCMAQLAPGSCPFAQPLEAMKRALDGHLRANDGFQRPDTFLQIVLVSTQDDCSASNDAIFDPSSAGLGPLSPFRCTQAGVTCDGVTVGSRSKAYGSCQPLESSTYLYPSSHYIDFLNGVSQDPDIVALSTVAGDPTPFAVNVGATGAPVLQPSCMAGLGPATPAVRLSALTEQLGRGRFVSACEGQPETALAQVDQLIRSGTQEPCVAGALVLDPSDGTPGVRPECTVIDEVTGADGSTQDTILPRCKMLSETQVDTQSEAPCWYAFVSADACPETETHIGVSVFRSATTSSDQIKTRATCVQQ